MLYIVVFDQFRRISAYYSNISRAGRRGDRGPMLIGKGLAGGAAWRLLEAAEAARADAIEEQAENPAEELR